MVHKRGVCVVVSPDQQHLRPGVISRVLAVGYVRRKVTGAEEDKDAPPEDACARFKERIERVPRMTVRPGDLFKSFSDRFEGRRARPTDEPTAAEVPVATPATDAKSEGTPPSSGTASS